MSVLCSQTLRDKTAHPSAAYIYTLIISTKTTKLRMLTWGMDIQTTVLNTCMMCIVKWEER